MTSVLPSEGRLLDDRYRLGRQLGAGGVAEVFRALDERLHREVAIKLFRGDVADQLQRHEEEMRTLARLDHAALVTVFDAGTDDLTGQPYLVMQLVEGSTLADQLRSGPLTAERTAEIGAELADGLAYVHGQGLVHRDVKPANVLIAADGRVHLADFGIARLVDSAHVTRTGDVLGTPAYFAPEQVAGEPVGPPADVYALGLVLLECRTGRRAYEGTPMEVAMARLTRQPELPGDIRAGWRDLLTGMTARHPTARLSAAQAAELLRRLSVGDERTVAMPPPAAPVAASTMVMPPVTTQLEPEAPVATPRRGPSGAVIALVLLIAVAAAVAVVVAVTRSNGSGTDCSTMTPPITNQTLENDMQSLEKLSCQ
jgi:serine/threonine protein kinase